MTISVKIKGAELCATCHGLAEASGVAGLAVRVRIDGVDEDKSHDLAERLALGSHHPAKI